MVTVWRVNIHAENQKTGAEREGEEYCTYTLGEYATHTKACEAVGRLYLENHGVIGITIAPIAITNEAYALLQTQLENQKEAARDPK